MITEVPKTSRLPGVVIAVVAVAVQASSVVVLRTSIAVRVIPIVGQGLVTRSVPDARAMFRGVQCQMAQQDQKGE